MHENLSVPVTCKIRIFKDVEKTIQYAKMLESSGNAIVEALINNIGPDLYNELKESDFGGHTDMYIPAGWRRHSSNS